MEYTKKKVYKITLTEKQILWLYDIFFKAFDGYFEGNKRESKLRDDIGKKIIKALE